MMAKVNQLVVCDGKVLSGNRTILRGNLVVKAAKREFKNKEKYVHYGHS